MMKLQTFYNSTVTYDNMARFCYYVVYICTLVSFGKPSDIKSLLFTSATAIETEMYM